MAQWQAYQPITRIISFNSKPGKKTVMVRITDAADSITHAQESIQLDEKASLPFLALLLMD